MVIIILCPSEIQTSPRSLHILELWWHDLDPPQLLSSPQHAFLSCCPELHHICIKGVWQLSVGPHILSAPLPPGLLLPCQNSHQPSGRNTNKKRPHPTSPGYLGNSLCVFSRMGHGYHWAWGIILVAYGQIFFRVTYFLNVLSHCSRV